MKTTHIKILGVILIYCVLFAWMSMPFVTADQVMFRKQVMFIDQLEHKIATKNQILASNSDAVTLNN